MLGVVEKSKRKQRVRSVVELEMHHEDYSKPLDVIWLCVPCHAKTRLKDRIAA